MAALIAMQAGFLVTNQNRGLAAPAGGAWPGQRSGGARRERPMRTPSPLRVSEITAAHLFGETHSTVDDANAPQTSVQLVLAGVLAVPDPKRGLAIIGPNAGTAKLYTVGSAIPGGVSLYSVYSDRVLLDRGGVIESLFLPRKAPLAGTGPQPADARKPGPAPGQRWPRGMPRCSAVWCARSRCLSGTKLSGYRIYPGGRTSVGAFTHLGLRPGDLITGVNGTPLDDPARANEILQTLSSLASANLTIQRNGQSQELTLNLETVASDAENVAASELRHEAPQGGAVTARLPRSQRQRRPARGGGSRRHRTAARRGPGRQCVQRSIEANLPHENAARICLVVVPARCARSAPCCCWPPRAGAQQKGPRITPNFKDADITQLIEAVSAATGKNFIIDPRVRAQVTWLSGASTALTPEQFYQGFLSVLQVHGFIAVPAGNIIKVLPDANMRQIPGSDLPNHVSATSDDVVTQVIAVSNVSAAQLVPVLRPADAAERPALGGHRRQHADHFRSRLERKSHDAHRRRASTRAVVRTSTSFRCRAPPRPTRCACSPRWWPRGAMRAARTCTWSPMIAPTAS